MDTSGQTVEGKGNIAVKAVLPGRGDSELHSVAGRDGETVRTEGDLIIWDGGRDTQPIAERLARTPHQVGDANDVLTRFRRGKGQGGVFPSRIVVRRQFLAVRVQYGQDGVERGAETR